MRIRIIDIPVEGRELKFTLERELVNDRVGLVRKSTEESHQPATGMLPPPYLFVKNPEVKIHLQLEGSTVVTRGEVHAAYETPCARCAEMTSQELDVPFDLVLKPRSAQTGSEGDTDGEDLHFGYYDNEEINCDEIAEEFLVLGVPFTVLCDESCKGLCAQCGQNLSGGPCNCPPDEPGDPRLAVLRQLKIQ